MAAEKNGCSVLRMRDVREVPNAAAQADTAPATGLRSHDMRAVLRAACTAAGGQRAWAFAHSIPAGQVCDVLRGRREMSEPIANALGYVRHFAYFPVAAKKTA